MSTLATPRVTRAWYVACRSDELGAKPRSIRIFGTPIVLFRTQGGTPGALLDRCPHRNVPLSSGNVVGESLQCAYHGWQFEPEGRCVHVPALAGDADRAAHRATSFPVREQQGYLWVWADPEADPTHDPFRFRLAEAPGYLVVHRKVSANASIHAVAENALDVPHTAFLHGGLFRNDGDRKPIRCVVKRWADRVECEYIGEARPEGLVGRMLSPSGGLVSHWDRFHLPSIVEVEYRIGDENHILVNAALTPETDTLTHLYAVVAFKTRLPGFLVKPVLTPFALRIFGQDAVILERQTETLERFGETRFVSTDLDLLGPHIFKLLQLAERGELGEPDREPTCRETTMWV